MLTNTKLIIVHYYLLEKQIDDVLYNIIRELNIYVEFNLFMRGQWQTHLFIRNKINKYGSSIHPQTNVMIW